MPHTKTLISETRSEAFLRRGLAVVMFAIMGGALSHAAATVREARQAVVETPAPINAQLLAHLEPVEPQIVWEGADIDGDGTDDFVNPTGKIARVEDAYGSGAYGASRDGGHRRHAGVDYIAEAGQVVVAPISGYVTKIGYAYGSDPSLKYVEIVNPALRYTARAFYVRPTVLIGETVAVGDAIGKAASLQRRYDGITDHIHLEIINKAGHRVDATKLITQRTVMGDEG